MIFRAVATLLLSAIISTAAQAQTYPTRPITLIVPFPAGGPTDGLARSYAQGMEAELGQPVIVDNRPGGGTMTGVMAAARSEPDGYTLTLGVSALTIQPTINPALKFDPVRDLTPITALVEPVQAFVVNSKSGINNIAELIAKAKKEPGRVTFASTGQGTATHIGGEYFAQFAGIELVHVPYPGSAPAVVDLLGGRVDMLLDAVSGSMAYMQSGELKALATTGPKRSAVTPDVPTVAETLQGFESRSFIGLFGPAKLPDAIRDRLYAASLKVMRNPAVADRVKALAMDIVLSDPATFRQLIARDTEKWRKIMVTAGIVKN